MTPPLRLLWAVLEILPSVTAAAASGPIVYQATGPTPQSLLPVINQFREAISRGGADNGNLPFGLFMGRREVDWQENGGNNVPPFYSVPNKGIFVGSMFPMAVSSTRFSNIDASYPETFQPFLSEAMAGVPNINTELFFTLHEAASQPHALDVGYSLGFGAVFSDVDLPGSSLLKLFTTGSEIDLEVPASPGNGNLSFIGAVFKEGDGMYVTGGAFRLGNHALQAGVIDGRAGVDLVSLDRLIYAEPSMTPEPSSMAIVGMGLLCLLLQGRKGTWRRHRGEITRRAANPSHSSHPTPSDSDAP